MLPPLLVGRGILDAPLVDVQFSCGASGMPRPTGVSTILPLQAI